MSSVSLTVGPFGASVLTLVTIERSIKDEPSLAYSIFSLPEFIGSTLKYTAYYHVILDDDQRSRPTRAGFRL